LLQVDAFTLCRDQAKNHRRRPKTLQGVGEKTSSDTPASRPAESTGGSVTVGDDD
jgi:hypothetical protein